MVPYKELYSFENILMDLDKNISSCATEPDINQLLGISALRSNNLSKAHFYFQKLLQSGNNNAYLFLGVLDELTGNQEGAEKQYMTLVAQGSRHAMYQMGQLEVKKGNLDKAVTFFENALYKGLECAMEDISAIKMYQREILENKKDKSIFLSMAFGPIYFLLRKRIDLAFLNVWLVTFFVFSLNQNLPEFNYLGWILGNLSLSLFIYFSEHKKSKISNKPFNILY